MAVRIGFGSPDRPRFMSQMLSLTVSQFILYCYLCCMFHSGEARPARGLLPKFNISLSLGMVLICEPTLIFHFIPSYSACQVYHVIECVITMQRTN